MYSEKEKLARLLSYASKNSEEEAETLIEKYKNLPQIFNTAIYSLGETLDDDMSTALYIKLVSALVSRRNTDKFKFQRKHTEEEIREYLVSLFFGASVEIAYMMSFDGQGKTISVDKINEGVINSSSVMPRKMIEIAKTRGAKSVVLAHNHPDGFAEPSKEDIESTRFIESILYAAKLPLLAHYVVSGADTKRVQTETEK